MVRACAAYALVGLLMLCPFVCGAAEVGHGSTHRHQESDGSPAPSHGPAHCPAGGDNCICAGAVQHGNVRVLDSRSVGLPFAFAASLGSTPHPIAHLTWDGSSSGLVGRGPRSAVRATLQNYRC